MTDTSANQRFDRDEAAHYLDVVFGDDQGTIAVAFGHNYDGRTHQRWYEATYANTLQGRAELLDRVASEMGDERWKGTDVYVCPALLRDGTTRRAENVCSSRVAWVDIDHDETNDVEALPTFDVASGSGKHLHRYVVLLDGVPDPTGLNRAMTVAYKGDSKFRANSLLRLPGTVNQKHGHRVTVSAWNGEAVTWDQVRLALEPYVKRAQVAAQTDYTGPTPDRRPVAGGDLPSGLRDYLAVHPLGEVTDRSAHGFGVIAMCVKTNLTLEETVAVVEEHTGYVEKWPDEEKRRRRIATEYHRKLADLPEFTVFEPIAQVDDDEDDLFYFDSADDAGYEAERVKWLWHEHIPAGAFTLLAGREQLGKSTLAYQLVADITNGTLIGESFGSPSNVLVVATEDSWTHTIIPRLRAAGADLHRVKPLQAKKKGTTLTFPEHAQNLARIMRKAEAALLLLDPLMSRLNGKTDTHKDADVRHALEPMIAAAEETGTAILGIIHVSKATTSDPVNAVMGSRAFTALPRAIVHVIEDIDDPSTRLVGVSKTNLGRMPETMFSYRIEEIEDVARDPDGMPISAPRIAWTGTRPGKIRDVMEEATTPPKTRTVAGDTAKWLTEYLMSQGGTARCSDVQADGARHGHSKRQLDRARGKAQVTSRNIPGVVPRATEWTLPNVVPLTADV